MTDRSTAEFDPNDPAAVEQAEQAAWDQLEAADGADDAGDRDRDDGTGEADGNQQDTSATDSDGDRGPAADQQDDQGQASDGDGGGTGGSDQNGQQADPWADAPEHLRAERDDLLKRVRGQDAKIQRMSRALSQANQQGRTSPRQTGQGGAAGDKPAGFSSDNWKRLKDDFPEIAEGFQAEIAARDAEIAELRGTVGGLSQAEAERQVEANERSLAEDHADFAQVVGSADYAAWVQEQPEDIRAIIAKNGQFIVDPAGASRVLTLYKADRQRQRTGETGAGPGAAPTDQGQGTGENRPGNGKRARQMESSAPGPRTGGPRVTDGPPGPNASEQEAWDYLERQERKRASA
jgi:hypothetical protein